MTMNKAIIVDIDGTLALKGERSPYDWSRVKEDSLNKPIRQIINAYNGTVIIVSGRDSVCERDTIEWLNNNDIHYDYLFMRDEGNNEKDTIIKQRIFDENIKDKFIIEFILEDRDCVVEMWRSLGLVCLQVAKGNF